MSSKSWFLAGEGTHPGDAKPGVSTHTDRLGRKRQSSAPVLGVSGKGGGTIPRS